MVRYALGNESTFSHEQLRFRHQDHHFPFREHAPSRKALRTITRDQALTHGGAFSFALGRATTISTSFVLNHPYLPTWTSFVDAKTSVELTHNMANEIPSMKATITDLHLCSMNAYGRTPNVHRNIEQARPIWEATEPWQVFVKKHQSGPIPWKEAFQWVKKTRPEIPQIKAMGLTGYLFLVDMAYAGIVVPPTVHDVGLQVNTMGRGAYNCLVHFCLVPNTKRRSPARELITITSFTQLFEDVLVALGTEEAERMGYDPVILEHTLCKYMRFFNNNYLLIPENTRDDAVGELKTHFHVEDLMEEEDEGGLDVESEDEM